MVGVKEVFKGKILVGLKFGYEGKWRKDNSGKEQDRRTWRYLVDSNSGEQTCLLEVVGSEAKVLEIGITSK